MMAHVKTVSNDEDDINNDEENDLFFFESEHLALRGNKDYSELIKTIVILEAQRTAAIKDIDTIIDIQKSAIEDPLTFIKKIKNGEDLGIPLPQKIAEIPEIDWSKYGIPIPEETFRMIDQEEIKDRKIPVKDPTKSKFDDKSTFKKPWTSEEQKKLEELLIKFPPEPIEMRRYKKIAEALGNRTVKQVNSRVQKYFLKLHKAGLPIPGRIPKIADKKRSYSHKHQRLNSYLYKPSTFFPDLEVPVFMTENDDEDSIPAPAQQAQNSEISNNKVIEEKDEIQLKIEILKRIREEKTIVSSTAHLGYKCDNCNEEPIIGSRWHCFDCQPNSIDFCSDCMITQLNSSNCHPLTHNLSPVRDYTDTTNPEPSSSELHVKSEILSDSESTDSESDSSSQSSDNYHLSLSHYDKDYVSNSFENYSGKYNYLDPNFLPE